ncbi:hypothetical protein [Sinomonas gamaensis]|uniref:hypothetical protein n=1 Tax=Sinomonas gamaensis TaxID=2565624 RepID=UPI0011088400|nr:hypothetical protein [Sinomonas gamaensis]
MRMLVVAPVDVTDSTARVLCPACDEIHSYYARDLEPIPIRPGEERTVTAKCYAAAARRSRWNCRATVEAGDLYPRIFKIRFPQKGTTK